eukprot:Awhi_evm1s12624
MKLFFEDFLAIKKLNNGKFMVGDDLTIADLHMYFALFQLIAVGMFDYFPTDYHRQWPEIKALEEAIANHPFV